MADRQSNISLGEGLAIVANAGVIIGLIFVWVELRQGQTQMKADIELSLAEAYQSVLSRAAENDHVAEIMILAYQDPRSLSQLQYVQLMSIHAEWMSIVYATYQLWQSGAISEQSWLSHSNYYLLFLQTGWLQDFWHGMDHDGLYPQAFIDSLESRMPAIED